MSTIPVLAAATRSITQVGDACPARRLHSVPAAVQFALDCRNAGGILPWVIFRMDAFVSIAS
jgi:hypothetical protein